MTYNIDVGAFERAVRIWQEMTNRYKSNIEQIKKDHRFTWMFRPSYWQNERYYHKSFVALINRRVQLQTAIKEKESSR